MSDVYEIIFCAECETAGTEPECEHSTEVIGWFQSADKEEACAE